MSTPIPTEDDEPTDRKPNRRPVLIVIGLVAAVVLILAVVNNQQRETSERDVDALVQALTPREVVYEVEGSASSVSITIETPTGTSQQEGVGLPLAPEGGGVGEHGLSANFQRGDFVYISAQNDGETGTVTCRITVDGRVVSENTADGAYSIATCKGSA